MRVLTLSCFVLWMSFQTTTQTSPGMILNLSEKGLQYAAKVAIDQMVSEIQGQTIPDQHGKDGKFDYDITGMRVASFARPSSSLVVNPGQGITWSLQGASASVHGDWRYKFKKGFVKISDHGSFDVSASDVSLTVSIAMGVDANGRPTISTRSCSCNVGDVSVKFHGGASWLYNLFRHTLEHPIKDRLRDMLCNSAKKAINVDATESLAKMKVQVPVGKTFILDYRLVATPVFGAQYVESEHKGEFQWAASPSDPPFQSSGISVPRDSQKMVTFCLSDYVMNTLGYCSHTHGLLKYTLTKTDLPAEDQAYLNTKCTSGTCIGSFLPQLAKAFPDGSVELVMETTSAPRMETTNDVITGHFEGHIIFNVRNPDGAVSHAFTSDMVTDMPLSVTMVDAHVSAHIRSFRFNVTKTESDIGDIPAPLLSFAFNLAANQFILPKLNELGEKGIELPGIDHVQFVNPEIQSQQGAVCFRTDVIYDPTLKFEVHVTG